VKPCIILNWRQQHNATDETECIIVIKFYPPSRAPCASLFAANIRTQSTGSRVSRAEKLRVQEDILWENVNIAITKFGDVGPLVLLGAKLDQTIFKCKRYRRPVAFNPCSLLLSFLYSPQRCQRVIEYFPSLSTPVILSSCQYTSYPILIATWLRHCCHS
jgi:hypothetical protein